MHQRDPISRGSGVQVGIFHSGHIFREKGSPAPARILASLPSGGNTSAPMACRPEDHERDQHAALSPMKPPKAKGALLGFLFVCFIASLIKISFPYSPIDPSYKGWPWEFQQAHPVR